MASEMAERIRRMLVAEYGIHSDDELRARARSANGLNISIFTEKPKNKENEHGKVS